MKRVLNSQVLILNVIQINEIGSRNKEGKNVNNDDYYD